MRRSRHWLRGSGPCAPGARLPGRLLPGSSAGRSRCPRVPSPSPSRAPGMTGDEAAGFDTDPQPPTHGSASPAGGCDEQRTGLPSPATIRFRASRPTSTPTQPSGFQRLGASRAHPTGHVVRRSTVRQAQECLQPSPKQPGFGVDGRSGPRGRLQKPGSPWVTGFGDLIPGPSGRRT